MSAKRRYKTRRYPKDVTSDQLARLNGLRFRRLYRRLFGEEPALFDPAHLWLVRKPEPKSGFESFAEDWLVRELEFQATIKAEIQRKLLAEQPEFHNKRGRPEGSKDKSPRKLYPEDEISAAAIRKRREKQ